MFKSDFKIIKSKTGFVQVDSEEEDEEESKEEKKPREDPNKDKFVPHVIHVQRSDF